MVEIHDIVYALIEQYPRKDYCFRSRIIRLVYLVDWKSLLRYNHRVMTIPWYYDAKRGPYNPIIEKSIEARKDLFYFSDIENAETHAQKRIYYLKPEAKYMPQLDAKVMSVIAEVVEITKDMGWQQFNTVVHSTYPLITGVRGRLINLEIALNEYKRRRGLQG